jgi:hypothetical protein
MLVLMVQLLSLLALRYSGYARVAVPVGHAAVATILQILFLVVVCSCSPWPTLMRGPPHVPVKCDWVGGYAVPSGFVGDICPSPQRHAFRLVHSASRKGYEPKCHMLPSRYYSRPRCFQLLSVPRTPVIHGRCKFLFVRLGDAVWDEHTPFTPLATLFMQRKISFPGFSRLHS